MIAKVCGITSAADARLALAAGADLVGFLQYPDSPRHCPDLRLAQVAGDRAILVTAAADLAVLLEQVRVSGARWVQPYLPAPERARVLAALRRQGCRILLPWPDEPEQEALAADLYLWESSPRDTGVLGGSGQGHALRCPPPGAFLLGGGLSGPILGERLRALPDPLRRACRGFDAASRLELAGRPGAKDSPRVQTFVATAHQLEVNLDPTF